MLILASTTDKLRLTTLAAGAIDVHASWLDNISGGVQPGRTNTNITTSTTTDIVGSPVSGVFRSIKTLHVRNKGTTINTVTVLHTDGATSVELHKAILAPGDTLQYIDEIGFKLVPASGDDGANRVLLRKWIPTAVNEYIIGPEIMLDRKYDLFEADWEIKSAGSDQLFVARISVDNGVTYPSVSGTYHVSGYNSASGLAVNTSGWNTFVGVATDAAYIGGIVGPIYASAGRCRIRQGFPGSPAQFARISSEWNGWTASGTVYQGAGRNDSSAAAAPGEITHFKFFLSGGGNFTAGFGYLKFYGVK